MLKLKGILKFDPPDKTNKHKSQASWKRVAIIELDCDIDAYYRWFIKKRYNLELNRPLRGGHITIINDSVRESPLYDLIKEKYDNTEIEFELDLNARTNGDHWWLKVNSPAAKDIREEGGLSREPYYTMHMTIGLANERTIAHSKYINRLLVKYGGSYN